MPYIDTTTTKTVTKELKEELTRAFGKAIELIPGKSEEWLMLNFNSDAMMAFRGTDKGGVAMLEVDLFGKAKESDKENLTAELCEIVSRVLGIPKDRTYVKYREFDCWGYNGANF